MFEQLDWVAFSKLANEWFRKVISTSKTGMTLLEVEAQCQASGWNLTLISNQPSTSSKRGNPSLGPYTTDFEITVRDQTDYQLTIDFSTIKPPSSWNDRGPLIVVSRLTLTWLIDSLAYLCLLSNRYFIEKILEEVMAIEKTVSEIAEILGVSHGGQ